MFDNGWDVWGVAEEDKRFGKGIDAGGVFDGELLI